MALGSGQRMKVSPRAQVWLPPPSPISLLTHGGLGRGAVPERWGRQKESGGSILHTVEVKLYVCKMDELVNELSSFNFLEARFMNPCWEDCLGEWAVMGCVLCYISKVWYILGT